MTKLAFWGSGPISNFHVPALREAGFDITGAHSRTGSDRLGKFCQNHQIKKIDNREDFLSGVVANSDAIFIALETSITPNALSQVINLGKPILCEKPGGINRTQLNEVVPREFRDNLRFSYNRRFYNTTSKLKSNIELGSKVNIQASMPDSIRSWHQFVINGCHLLDLMLHVLDFDFELISAEGSTQPDGPGFVFMGRSSRGDVITFNQNWGASQNVVLRVDCPPFSYVLSPFESLTTFKGLERKEPTPEYPLRRYVPVVDNTVMTEVSEFKPGFFEQSCAFYQWVVGKKNDRRLATMTEALEVLSLIDQIKSKIS